MMEDHLEDDHGPTIAGITQQNSKSNVQLDEKYLVGTTVNTSVSKIYTYKSNIYT